VEVGLDREWRCKGEQDPIGSSTLELRVPRGTSVPVYVSVRTKVRVKGEYQLVRITERSKDDELGGIAFVVVSETERIEAQS
jgi:hypothetical protein